MGANNNDNGSRSSYWRDNLFLVGVLLAIWFASSYLLGIVFVDQLNEIRLFGFRLGFWFAQQGSIYIFLVLIWVYVWRMRKIDRRHGVDEG